MEKVVSSEKSKAPLVEAKREEHAPRRSPLSSEFDHRVKHVFLFWYPEEYEYEREDEGRMEGEEKMGEPVDE